MSKWTQSARIGYTSAAADLSMASVRKVIAPAMLNFIHDGTFGK
jgi:hypothetical protein